ncbi:MAG: ABC transporter transmembrane domain-containing protein, partial [Actinomycetota bacterium]|nr:ABC transporter transmembrane domain-containing protein [Actinomycetota bacterium]
MLGKLLIRYLARYWPLLITIVVLQFASVMASLNLPEINADIINNGVAKADIGYIWNRGGFMLLVSLGQILASILATFFAARMAMSAGRDIRADVFARVSGFSEREVSQFGAGSLITRNTNDVQQVQMLAMMGATMFVTAPLLAIGGIIKAIQTDVGLSWLIAVSVPLLLVIAVVIIGRMVPLFRRNQAKLDDVNRIMREQLTGVRVVRAFVRERIEERRFRTVNTDLMVLGRNIGSLFVLMFPLFMLVLNVTIVAVVWFGGVEINAGNAEIGTIFAFMQYIGQIMMGVIMSSFMAMMIPRAAVSAERVTEVLDAESSMTRPENGVTDFPEPGAVAFRNVEFTYPGAEVPVLSDITFDARPGETVA